jgi:hypothetical protein
MTSTGRLAPASERTRTSLASRIVGWIGTRQQGMSDRAHANGDAYAVAQGWTVTASTGRFGFGTRTYRDPRFDSLRRQSCPTAQPQIAEPPGTASARGRMETHPGDQERQHHDL